MVSEFRDYFSTTPENYRLFRPTYPAALFSYLASLAPSPGKAWDCATGTGQVAGGLIRFFNEVIATDGSWLQIAHSKKEKGVRYLVMLAERTGFNRQEFDIITVAQALHWFNIQTFFKEAARVLKPGGILAVWSYDLLRVNTRVDAVIKHFYEVVLADYWPAERKLVENGYKDIVFPFQEVTAPSFEMTAQWSLNQLLGYIATWSAVAVYHQQRNRNILPQLHDELAVVWGKKDNLLPVKWPLSLKIGKNDHSG